MGKYLNLTFSLFKFFIQLQVASLLLQFDACFHNVSLKSIIKEHMSIIEKI